MVGGRDGAWRTLGFVQALCKATAVPSPFALMPGIFGLVCFVLWQQCVTLMLLWQCGQQPCQHGFCTPVYMPFCSWPAPWLHRCSSCNSVCDPACGNIVLPARNPYQQHA